MGTVIPSEFVLAPPAPIIAPYCPDRHKILYETALKQRNGMLSL
jgi:hypothetical protein